MVLQDLALPQRRELFIDGSWRTSSESFAVIDPANERVICEVADAGARHATAAVDAAHAAFATWSRAAPNDRARLLFAARDALENRLDELARIMTQEQGKPVAEARGELAGCVEMLDWYGEESKRLYGEIVPSPSGGKRQFVVGQPQGVVAIITPWNFPAMMIVRKAASALAAGCTVVVKPAEQTPLTALALFEVLEEAGLPRGVANLVTASDPAPVGDVLLRDERVRHVTFTGSTSVGRHLASEASKQIKRVSLELGGHAPYLVFEDADLELAASHLLATKFRNAGQTCVNPNRVLVESAVADQFAERLAEGAAALVVGSGFDDGVDVGPLIDPSAVEKVSAHVEDARARGAEVLTGGERIDRPGYFFSPTVLRNMTPDMRLAREETFGPVAPLAAFPDEREAVERANATAYGLTAYVYTRDLDRAIRVAEALEYGVVGINDNRPSSAQTPFGGFKESGLGREGGRQGVEEFLETKTISIGLAG